MSAIELKQKMHNQIELLFDASDIEELAVNDGVLFLNRSIHFDSNTIEFTKKLPVCCYFWCNPNDFVVLSTLEI